MYAPWVTSLPHVRLLLSCKVLLVGFELLLLCVLLVMLTSQCQMSLTAAAGVRLLLPHELTPAPL